MVIFLKFKSNQGAQYSKTNNKTKQKNDNASNKMLYV